MPLTAPESSFFYLYALNPKILNTLYHNGKTKPLSRSEQTAFPG